MPEPLSRLLTDTWANQVELGFVLGDPAAPIETRFVPDPASGVTFRFRWLPHRALRTDTDTLERRGILNPDRDESALYRDPRDPSGRHCFLCPENIRQCHPLEELIPMHAGGRAWFAGANFAWLARNHFTVIAADHVDQSFNSSVVETMLDLHRQTAGEFRIVYNGAHAGATIPWHLHFHIATDPFPVESLDPERAQSYPMPLRIFAMDSASPLEITQYVNEWEAHDPQHHRVNLLVASSEQTRLVWVFLRDTRAVIARNKGLMGGWEVGGDFAYDDRRDVFEAADISTVRAAFADIVPLLSRGM